jgi:GNAT superfamily N-acetyltransferase
MSGLVEFVPERGSREEWERYHSYRVLLHREWRPDEPLVPDEVAEITMKRRNPFDHHHWYQVVDGAQMVGELYAEGPLPESPGYATNRHLLFSWGYVARARRRAGLGRSMVPAVLALMDEHGASLLTTLAEDEPGHAFLRHLGAEPRLTQRQSRLDLRQVDWDMVARWVRDGPAASPQARLDLYPDSVPDDVLEEYSTAISELMNTIPTEDMDRGDMVMTPDGLRDWAERRALTGSVLPTCVVRDAGGSIVGMTDVLVQPYEPGIVRQMFTGVHPRARGHGLGRWMKAAMLEHVRREYPEATWIITENAGSNAPMLSINHALGFRLHRTITVYQVGADRLRQAV